MKILLTHRYFWPDSPPYAIMIRTIGQFLSDAGNDVHVFSSKPSYRGSMDAPKLEQIDKLNIVRAWVFQENKKRPIIRGINVLIYCFRLFFHILKLRPDVVTAATFPPVLAAWTGSLASKMVGAKFIYHMMDIHPEVSTYTNGFLGRGVFAVLLRVLDNQTLRRSHRVLVLSEDMGNSLITRGFENLPIEVMDNLYLESIGSEDLPAEHFRKPSKTVRAIFAGNLGQFQYLPSLTEGIALCFEDNPNLELVFLGDGTMEADLKARWDKHPQVRFIPFLPFSQAKILIAESDIGLVSLAPNLYKVAYPSKIMNYLRLGVPVLALVEPESHMARDLVEKKAGSVPASYQPEDIKFAMETLLSAIGSDEIPADLTEGYLSKDEILQQWLRLVGAIPQRQLDKV